MDSINCFPDMLAVIINFVKWPVNKPPTHIDLGNIFSCLVCFYLSPVDEIKYIVLKISGYCFRTECTFDGFML